MQSGGKISFAVFCKAGSPASRTGEFSADESILPGGYRRITAGYAAGVLAPVWNGISAGGVVRMAQLKRA